MPNNPGILSRTANRLQRLEDGILVTLLLVMILLAVLQIFLRNLFDSGIVWADPLVRVLVLWIGLVGAMAASRTDNHISIDVVSRFLPPGVQKITKLLVYLFTAGIAALMAWHGFRFVLMEKADNLMAFASVPAWICESIIPFAFCVISLRYLIFFIQQLVGAKRS